MNTVTWRILSEYHEEVIGELINECLSQITATIGD